VTPPAVARGDGVVEVAGEHPGRLVLDRGAHAHDHAAPRYRPRGGYRPVETGKGIVRESGRGGAHGTTVLLRAKPVMSEYFYCPFTETRLALANKV
jgi:hypothetical protein